MYNNVHYYERNETTKNRTKEKRKQCCDYIIITVLIL